MSPSATAPGSEVIEGLQKHIRELEEYIRSIKGTPLGYATVLKHKDESLVVSTANGLRHLTVSPKLKQLHPGDEVLIQPGGGFASLIEKVHHHKGRRLATVKAFMADGRAEVEVEQGTAVCIVAHGVEVKKGDRVLLDSTGTVIVTGLGKENRRHAMENETNVSWENVGGQDKAKAALREAIELPTSCPGILEFYGQKPTNAICLYGPPGNGKTLLAKAAATALSTLQGGNRGGFFYIKGPEILSKWVGEAERGIREVFAAGRDYLERTGIRPILFFDEVDAIAGNRSTERGVSGMERTIVPQMLSELDGLDAQGPLVLLATNRVGSLDPAILREGRCDLKIEVSRPTKEEAFHVFSVHLRDVPLKDVSISQLAKEASELVYDPEHVICQVPYKGKKVDLLASSVASGAMIAGMVREAKSVAINRDLKSKERSGVMAQDLWTGIRNVLESQRHIDHRETVAAMEE